MIQKEKVLKKIKDLWDSHLYDEASAMQELIDWLENEPEEDPTKIVLPVTDDTQIIAEVNPDRDYREIFIGVMKRKKYWQDLVLVREGYEFKESFGVSEYVPHHGEYEVMVYGDGQNEDWTESFIIQEWKEEN